MATNLTQLKDDLVTANRVLAHHNVVDSFGHVSMRHPADLAWCRLQAWSPAESCASRTRARWSAPANALD